MKYKFQRLQMKRVPRVIGWYLVIDNAKDLWLYRLNDNISQSIIGHAVIDDIEVKAGNKHYSTDLSNGISQLSKIRQQCFSDTLSQAIMQSQENQFKLIKKGYSILFAENGISYSIDKNNEIYNVLDEIIKDVPVFPECGDVHYSQWSNGIHWYARIGCTDIKDKNGNMKWLTKEEAEKASEWFLSNKQGDTK